MSAKGRAAVIPVVVLVVITALAWVLWYHWIPLATGGRTTFGPPPYAKPELWNALGLAATVIPALVWATWKAQWKAVAPVVPIVLGLGFHFGMAVYDETGLSMIGLILLVLGSSAVTAIVIAVTLMVKKRRSPSV